MSTSGPKARAPRSVLKKPEKLITCRECGFAWPKNRYYETCYKGIDCPAVSGGNPSNQYSQEPPLKIAKTTELSTLQSILIGAPSLGEPRRKLPDVSNVEQPSPRQDLHSLRTNQVACVLQGGAGPASKIVESNQAGPAEASTSNPETSFDPPVNRLVETAAKEKETTALLLSSTEAVADHHECEEAVTDGVHNSKEASGLKPQEAAEDGSELTDPIDYSNGAWYRESESDEDSEDAASETGAEEADCATQRCQTEEGSDPEDAGDWGEAASQQIDSEQVPSKSGANAAWRDRGDELLFSGSPRTVLEATLEALQSKRFNKISDNAFDRESKRIAGLLPQPNAYPPSLYAAKQVVGAENLQQYEVHTCVNDCVRFEKLARNEFSLHKDDICPICKQPRFEEYETLKGVCYRPRKSMIEFGVKKAVQELWADPDFCKARNGGAERDFDGTDFWGGGYVEEINESVDGLLFRGENGGYELGFDYGQPWKRQKYSLGVVCIRSLDLPGERRSEKRFRKSVAIIPGPKEPKWLWPYFSGALIEFVVAWKKGIQLVDSYTRQAVQHHAFLCLVSSDTLARNALLEHVAVAAFLGCGKCWMEGCKYEGCGHGTYFAGYARPAPQKILGGGRGILAKDSRNRTHQ